MKTSSLFRSKDWLYCMAQPEHIGHQCVKVALAFKGLDLRIIIYKTQGIHMGFHG